MPHRLFQNQRGYKNKVEDISAQYYYKEMQSQGGSRVAMKL